MWVWSDLTSILPSPINRSAFLWLAREAFDGLSRQLPADDPARLDAAKRYAEILGTSGDQARAMELLAEVIRQQTVLHGREHPARP